MAQIISANYRNRESEYKWLVRDESEHPDKAIACKSVTVDGRVSFVKSSQYEEGFGCKVVASTDSPVHLVDIEQKPLKFDGHVSFIDGGGNIVKEVNSIELREDGSILAAF